jgi:hypothetical protein
MAATPKPHRKKMNEFVSKAREHIKEKEPNKAVRKGHMKKGLSEEHKNTKKSEKNRHKAMY